MTSRERITRILKHQPVDRVGLFEVFWRETVDAWHQQGRLKTPESVSDHFGLDVRRTSGEITPMPKNVLDMIGNLDAGLTVVEESETARLVRDGNGALLRWLKGHSGGPEHVDFSVRDRASWEERIKPHLLNEAADERRIRYEFYRTQRMHCACNSRFLACGVVGAFDLMSPMCGHEYLLMGMALDPEWVTEMADLYARTTVRLLEKLFEREGLPDGLWVWDDLGFKNKPFMSPAMYRQIVMPAHKRLFDFAHSRGLPVVLHCDGFVEGLLPSLVEAGIDCLQPIECKAGMDLLKLKREYGKRIAFIGGMDERTLETNDLAVVDAELEGKLPGAMEGSGYILQVDHSVSSRVEYATYKHFVEKGLALGTY
jgi:uroporphyrinogen decarboxylase